MSIVVYNSQYKKADLKKAKFDELYVVFNGYEYKLSDKKFAETDKNGNKTEIKSVKQFESALKEGRLLFNNTKVKMNTDPKRTRGILFPPEYLTTLELPKDNTYVSDRINVGGEKNPIPMGLKRALVYREAYAKGERREQYVYLKIHGKSEMEFVPLKSIGYYEGMKREIKFI